MLQQLFWRPETELVTLDTLADDGKARMADAHATELRIKQDVARELQDRVAQPLAAMLVEMENFNLLEFERERMVAEVTLYQDAIRDVLGNIREILYELRGQKDLGRDFPAWVGRMLDRFQAQTGILTRFTVSATWPSRLAIMASINLYRMLEEALNNVRRHSGAKLVEVFLGIAEGDLAVVSVVDDGQALQSGLADGIGLGRLGMRERALLLGGEMTIKPVSPHRTELAALIPKEKLI